MSYELWFPVETCRGTSSWNMDKTWILSYFIFIYNTRMNIYYQWLYWAYSHIASNIVAEKLDRPVEEVKWVDTFSYVWDKIWTWNIWVLPIENSYAWSIHENLYNFLKYDFNIIWEVNLAINHNLLSKETDILDINKAYSHPQALSQCYYFLKKHNIKPIIYNDTSSAAKMVSESSEKWVAAIASSLAGETYKLNNIWECIQDQQWNTTRFFVVWDKSLQTNFEAKKWKTTILFETKNIPASLYKCLWAFATNWINLTKVESIPSLETPFTYIFWLDFDGRLVDDNIKKALEELSFSTNSVKILGEY